MTIRHSAFRHVNSLKRAAAAVEPATPAKYRSPYPRVGTVLVTSAKAAVPTASAAARGPAASAPDLSTFRGRLQQHWRSAGCAVLGALTLIGALPFAAPAAATAGVAAVFVAGGLTTTFLGVGYFYSARGQ